MQIPTSPFTESYGHYFRGNGVSGSVASGTTGNVDFKVTEERWINGCHLLLKDHVFADSLCFQIVDVDNIFGLGANTILNEFAKDWHVASDKQDQGVFKIEYPAKILANLYIRIKYTSTGQNNVSVACNFFLHKKI